MRQVALLVAVSAADWSTATSAFHYAVEQAQSLRRSLMAGGGGEEAGGEPEDEEEAGEQRAPAPGKEETAADWETTSSYF